MKEYDKKEILHIVEDIIEHSLNSKELIKRCFGRYSEFSCEHPTTRMVEKYKICGLCKALFE